MGNKDNTQTVKFFDPRNLPMRFHPGEDLEEKLQEMGMSVKEFATRVSKPEKTIIAVIKGKSSVTPEMAVAFEMVTKIPADLWLNMQKSYDEFIARKKREKEMKDGDRWLGMFPFTEIAALGWFETPGKDWRENEAVETLCSFFAVSSPKGWEDFYLNQRLRVAFRITLAETCDPYALSAWLRRGEIQVGEIRTEGKFSTRLMRSKLKEISALRKDGARVDSTELKETLSQAGVKLIFTENLSSAPVKGCARYVYGSPCIQLSASLAEGEEAWWTLWHEIGHILLHGKKNIFMENVNYGDKDPEKEKEANDFADHWMKN